MLFLNMEGCFGIQFKVEYNNESSLFWQKHHDFKNVYGGVSYNSRTSTNKIDSVDNA